MAQPRIFYAMARDRLFFSFAEKIHHRFKTPYMSTILCGVICSLSAAFLPMELLSQMSSMGTLLAFALVALSVIVLRYRYPELPRAFRVPGPLWGLPALSFFSSLWLMSYGQNITFVGLLLWSGVGLIFYFAYGLYRFLTTSSIF
jgi:APA family basic amino acid/polyamine antiporter